MKLTDEIYQRMVSCPQVPPETGGIIGSSDGEIIDSLIFDFGLSNGNGGVYIPNVNFINQNIIEWAESGIKFYGIFHTHILQWSDLSNGDKTYITQILTTMPSGVNRLYFPLVFPNRNLKCYVAIREDNIVNIINDDIKIIKKAREKNEKE